MAICPCRCSEMLVWMMLMMLSLMPNADSEPKEGQIPTLIFIVFMTQKLLQMMLLCLLLLLMPSLAGAIPSTTPTRPHLATTATALSPTASAALMEPSSQEG